MTSQEQQLNTNPLIATEKAKAPCCRLQGIQANDAVTDYLGHAQQDFCVSHAFVLSCEVHNTALYTTSH